MHAAYEKVRECLDEISCINLERREFGEIVGRGDSSVQSKRVKLEYIAASR